MSWALTYFIEDPITDVQLLPSHFMKLSKPIIYLESSWNDFKPKSEIDLRFYYPSFFNKTVVGLGYHTHLYQRSENAAIGLFAYKFRDVEQCFSFLTGIPFLKKDGFLAIKLTYLYNCDNINEFTKSCSDTFYVIDGDTTKLHSSDYAYYANETKSPQWWISFDQLLPLQKMSSLDFIFQFCPYSYHRTDDDTIISIECDSTIFYTGLGKVIASYQDSAIENHYSSEEKALPTGIFTIMYNTRPSWGQLRLMGRFGLSKGSTNRQYGLISSRLQISKTYVIYPDTNYFYGDSAVTYDTSDFTLYENRIIYNSVVGAGANFPVKKDNILLGIKLGHCYDRKNYDTIYTSHQSYSALFSVGYEWFPASFLCLRDGLNIYLFNDISTYNANGVSETYKSSIFDSEGALGLGIKAGNHLKFDYATDIDFDYPLKYWSLDCTYVF